MESMSEEFRKRENDKPDKWTLLWWKMEYAEQRQVTKGAVYACNRVVGEFADRVEKDKEIWGLLEHQARVTEELAVKFGKSQAAETLMREDVMLIQQAMEASREAWHGLRKDIADLKKAIAELKAGK